MFHTGVAYPIRAEIEGTGRPGALRHELSGCWSRRIDREHRLVYQVSESKIRVLACRFHYGRFGYVLGLFSVAG